jgi:hypothetical protein
MTGMNGPKEPVKKVEAKTKRPLESVPIAPTIIRYTGVSMY